MAKGNRSAPPAVIGVDLGSSAVKATVLRGDGQVLSTARNPTKTTRPSPGMAEQQPEGWYVAMCQAVRQAVEAAALPREAIIAMGFSGFGHVPVLLDAAGEVVRPSILWSDRRSDVQACELDRALGEELRAVTLNEPSPTWTLPQLRWLAEHEPDSLQATTTLLVGKDALVHWATGERVTDRGSAASSMLYDVRTGAWSSRFTAACDMRADQLPAVVMEDEVVGTLRPAVAEELGLPASVSVVCGGLDSTMELVGLASVADGDGAVRIGTAGGAVRLTARPEWQLGTIVYPHPGGLWQRQCFSSNAGCVPAWGARLLGLQREECGGQGSGGEAVESLLRLAAGCPPGADGVLFHPYLNGERAPVPSAYVRAGFIGLDISHGPPQMARAILEGVAFTVRSCVEALWPAGAPPWLAAAGGATRNPGYIQMLADVLRVPLRIFESDSSSLGAAIVASVGAGVFRNMEEAQARCVAPIRTVQPVEKDAAVNAEAFERFAAWAPGLYEGYETAAAGSSMERTGVQGT